MQDLRDKLLQAGLVDKKTARAAKTDKRRKRKKKGGQKALQRELRQQEQRHAERRRAEAEQARQRQEAINRQRAETEALARVRDLIRGHAVWKIRGNDRPFYFLGPDGRVRRFFTSFPLAEQLSLGRLAIAAYEDDETRDFAVVDRECAARLEQLAPGRLLFWNRDGAPEHGLPAYGAGPR